MTFTVVAGMVVSSGSGGGGGGSGDALTSDPLSQFAATTSAQFAGVISDEVGTGKVILQTSPTLITPLLGTPTSGVLTNCTGTALGLVAGLANSRTIEFVGDQFENPTSANWVVNALAPAVADSVNSALIVRAFDDTVEEGVGFSAMTPVGATNIKLSFVSKAATAPGATNTVGLKLYYRQIPDNAAPDTGWAGAADGSVVLTDISIPTNVTLQYDTQTLGFVAGFAPDLVAGKFYQFELTRIAPAGGTPLTGDWRLLSLKAEIY